MPASSAYPNNADNEKELFIALPCHTFRKSQIMSKNSIFRKILKILNLNFPTEKHQFFANYSSNLNFRAKNRDFVKLKNVEFLA